LVDQVLDQLVALVTGLVAGLVTGFYFERRAGRETRKQNKQLRAELEALRSSVYTVGGAEKPSDRDILRSPEDLVSEVVNYAKIIQDTEGRVRRSLLVEHFTANGCLPSSVNEALHVAQESGALSLNEMWVTIQ
jgi:hypothetical protein